jgi:hypothetical protein
MSLAQFDERTPYVRVLAFDSTYTPGTLIPVVQAMPVTVRIDAITCMNNDGSSHVLRMYLQLAGYPTTLIGMFTVPAGAGTGTTPPADALAQISTSDQKWVLLAPFEVMTISLDSAPSGSNIVTVYFRGGTV